ncbi:MarR family transcriptional regulator [Chryseobacterium sp. SSA4.19]|uniref:MarR family winged helix-turn-helix transcriptional regulator n=1 Tax=Chryseobacterium sp. SSA4.19 TaxID=2919915 RepID=UPI001F4E4C64|nr:helix-turn-helix domain-containing protein [Chryseobacterium sp. SSA4.19]MCJ8153019.1 MarR family transcriptional regulator [Chryseobacterium sp. SSA4.19]
MNSDFIKELGYKALDSRMKRISDRISYSVKKLYKENNMEIEPHWYLVFMLLQHKDKMSIAEIAEQLGYSHPTLVITIKKMNAKGYLTVVNDEFDKRRQIVSLSEKAVSQMPDFEILWKSCEAAILSILDHDLGIVQHLDRIDEAIEKTSFYYRFKQEYSNNIQ